jgi:hypothetical protein
MRRGCIDAAIVDFKRPIEEVLQNTKIKKANTSTDAKTTELVNKSILKNLEIIAPIKVIITTKTIDMSANSIECLVFRVFAFIEENIIWLIAPAIIELTPNIPKPYAPPKNIFSKLVKL